MLACVAQHKLHSHVSLTRFRGFLTLFCFPPWLQGVLEPLDRQNYHSRGSTKGLRAMQVGKKASGEGIKVLSKVWNIWAINCVGSKERIDRKKEEVLDLDWF